MLNPFRKPSLIERLTRLREETREARVEASARVAYWANQEQFLYRELQRLSSEIDELADDEAAQPFLVGATPWPDLSSRQVDES